MSGTSVATVPAATPRKPWYKILYVQVLLAIVLGAVLGWLFPDFGKNDWVRGARRRLRQADQDGHRADHFLHGGVGHRPYRRSEKVGRVAVKSLLYFEVVSTFALFIGLIVANVLQPGAGFSGKTDAAAVAGFAKQASEMKSVDFVLHIIPDSAIGAFAARRYSAGSVVFRAVRLRPDGARRTRQPAAVGDR